MNLPIQMNTQVRRITTAQKSYAMGRMLSTPQGRVSIAASITEPLKKLQDYESIGRKALMIDDLADGDIPIYDKDPEIFAYVVAEEGRTVMSVPKSDRIHVPTFEISTAAAVPFTQVKERRFDVPKRIKEKVRSQIFRIEDKLIFTAMDAAASANTGQLAPQTSDISQVGTTVGVGPVAGAANIVGAMSDVMGRMEEYGHAVDKIFMNGRTVGYLRKAGRDYFDFETQKEILRTGKVATMYGADIFHTPEIPINVMYFCAAPELLGILPVRMELNVLSADMPAERQYAWVAFEAIGIGFHNSEYGLIKLTLS